MIYCVFILSLFSTFNLIVCTNELVNADFNETYNGTVFKDSDHVYVYNYLEIKNVTQAVRLHVTCSDADTTNPLLLVIRQQRDVISFQIPMVLDLSYNYHSVSKTLCPVEDSLKIKSDKNQTIYVDVTTNSPFFRPLNFSITAIMLPQFTLGLNMRHQVTLSPSEPQYFLFRFPHNVDSVRVFVESPDNYCMIFSIQSVHCPVYDSVNNVAFTGVYQTVAGKGAISADRSSYDTGTFYVVLVLKATDFACQNSENIRPPGPRSREKKATIRVEETLPTSRYVLPVVGAATFYGAICFIAIIISGIYQCCFSYESLLDVETGTGSTNYGSTSEPGLVDLMQGKKHIPDEKIEVTYGDDVTGTRKRVENIDKLRTGYLKIPNLGQPEVIIDLKMDGRDGYYVDHLIIGKNINKGVLYLYDFAGNIGDQIPVKAGDKDTIIKVNSNIRRVFLTPSDSLGSEAKEIFIKVNIIGGIKNQSGSLVDLAHPEPRHSSPISGSQLPGPSHGSTQGERSGAYPRHGRSSEDTSDTSNDLDMLDDASTDKNVYRTNLSVFVADLSRKKGSTLVKKYKMYHWYLLIISIFYGLPVIQLVLTYQKVLHNTGNEDMCYYNFYCSHPFKVISAFNSVFSNIGYFILGILFLILTFRRNVLYKNLCDSNKDYRKLYGIPQHFGLFYAMGLGLSMEGVMSACYHICPSNNNFQFDTAFMYILACLCMLKMYQIRHPDINASAHAAYMMMAVVILIGVIGVLYGTLAFWIVFTILYLSMSIFLTAEIYYMGCWSLDLSLPKRIYLIIRIDGCQCFKPLYPDRMILMIVANIFNWSLALYGVIQRPPDFSSFLVSIFMANLFMYTIFYIIMKLRYGERLLPLPIIYMVLSGLCGGSAIYFFLQLSTSWEMSPAQSRSLNEKCLLLDFYDMHDVWHFLSSLGMFFAFMMLLNLDDDLIHKRRDTIRVF